MATTERNTFATSTTPQGSRPSASVNLHRRSVTRVPTRPQTLLTKSGAHRSATDGCNHRQTRPGGGSTHPIPADPGWLLRSAWARRSSHRMAVAPGIGRTPTPPRAFSVHRSSPRRVSAECLGRATSTDLTPGTARSDRSDGSALALAAVASGVESSAMAPPPGDVHRTLRPGGVPDQRGSHPSGASGTAGLRACREARGHRPRRYNRARRDGASCCLDRPRVWTPWRALIASPWPPRAARRGRPAHRRGLAQGIGIG